jgi:hypothetical protein
MRLILGREEQRGISQLPLIWNLHFGERGKFVTVVTPDEMPFKKLLDTRSAHSFRRNTKQTA